MAFDCGGEIPLCFLVVPLLCMSLPNFNLSTNSACKRLVYVKLGKRPIRVDVIELVVIGRNRGWVVLLLCRVQRYNAFSFPYLLERGVAASLMVELHFSRFSQDSTKIMTDCFGSSRDDSSSSGRATQNGQERK